MKLSELLTKPITIRQSNIGYVWTTGSWTFPSWGNAETEVEARNAALLVLINSATESALHFEGRVKWLEDRVAELEKAIGDDKPDAICPICERKANDVERRHRNSCYVTDDDLNYMFSCGECYREDFDNLQGDWDDYRASQF